MYALTSNVSCVVLLITLSTQKILSYNVSMIDFF